MSPITYVMKPCEYHEYIPLLSCSSHFHMLLPLTSAFRPGKVCVKLLSWCAADGLRKKRWKSCQWILDLMAPPTWGCIQGEMICSRERQDDGRHCAGHPDHRAHPTCIHYMQYFYHNFCGNSHGLKCHFPVLFPFYRLHKNKKIVPQRVFKFHAKEFFWQNWVRSTSKKEHLHFYFFFTLLPVQISLRTFTLKKTATETYLLEYKFCLWIT